MQLGERGERIAERFLHFKGWRTVQRRFRSGARDIDLVMEREGIVAFVEVKTRTGVSFGSPVEAVGVVKRRHLVRSARAWVAVHGRAADVYRFDVVGVWLDGDRIRVRHVESAFSVPSR